MVDFLSRKERSERMARIRGKNTFPELTLRKILHRMGFRYRLHNEKLPGKPDIVLPRYRSVVFVHGCFWHRHEGCRIATLPKSNTQFWVEKFERNVARDARVKVELERLGWRIFIVWECELSSTDKASKVGEYLAKELKANILRITAGEHR
ncbi:DNA mismatch endonuclease Vsr [Burkholderia sp. SRS-25]|uniref:very short patch repair endonuclease n=1 Tax=Burkholderia sp. SRS-25 TaxID=2094190 RepID=UPI0010434FF8|nr:DNA mismatch endonuclease Vsr [Burkholderia sp. SRS-25]TCW63390.1 very short patch repair endonuclease [Burkholderia sp. SRS-25]